MEQVTLELTVYECILLRKALAEYDRAFGASRCVRAACEELAERIRDAQESGDGSYSAFLLASRKITHEFSQNFESDPKPFEPDDLIRPDAEP